MCWRVQGGKQEEGMSMNPVVIYPLGTQLIGSLQLTLPDVTSSMWSYVSTFLTWPPVLAILGLMFGISVGSWVWGKISEVMTRRG
jgi:hypothetical protein